MGDRAAQLPPGRHGLSRDYVHDNQRTRILAATARVTAAHGYPGLTIERVIGDAGVSRKTFYQHFRNKEEVFLAAYDDAVARLTDRIAEAESASRDDFTRNVEATLDATLRFLAEHPDQARLVVVEVLAAGPRAVRRRHESLRTLVDLVDRGTCALAEEEGLRTPPAITAETVVGGMVEVVYNRVERGETDTLPTLLADLVYCALLPYVGPGAAAAEHGRLTSSPDRADATPGT